MAWTISAIDEITEDRPIILSKHEIADATNVGAVWNLTGTYPGTDATAQLYPTAFSYDGFAHKGLVTKPSPAQVLWYLVYSVPSGIEFDVGVLQCEYSASLVEAAIADNAAFTARQQTIMSTNDLSSISTVKRYFEGSFSHLPGRQRYLGVEYLRLEFTTVNVPLVSEFWVGLQHQLSYYPDYPYQDLRSVSDVNVLESRSGLRTIQRTERGARATTVNINITSEAELETMRNIWASTEYGQRPFYWIETPATDPKAHLMRMDGNSGFNPVYRGQDLWIWRISMIEQSAFQALDE